jgi:hypothetical protein
LARALRWRRAGAGGGGGGGWGGGREGRGGGPGEGVGVALGLCGGGVGGGGGGGGWGGGGWGGWGGGGGGGGGGAGGGGRGEGMEDEGGQGEPEIVEIVGGIVALIGGGEAAGDYGRLRWGAMRASSIAGEAREHDTAVSQADEAERRRGSHVLADGPNEKRCTIK